MTSSEVARRRSGGDQHAAMFVWSKGHVTVRDLVARRLVPVPTIVRMATGFNRDSDSTDRFHFREGTVSDNRPINFMLYVFFI